MHSSASVLTRLTCCDVRVCVCHDRIIIIVCNYFCHNCNIVSLYLHKHNIYNDRLKRIHFVFIWLTQPICTDSEGDALNVETANGTTKNDNTNIILNCDKFPLMSPKFIYYMNNNKATTTSVAAAAKTTKVRRQQQWNKNDNKRTSHTETFMV